MFHQACAPGSERLGVYSAPVRTLATGFDRAEGPVWFGNARCRLFSDIPNNRTLRRALKGLTTYRQPSHCANVHTRDRQGRLIPCQHGTRSVTLNRKGAQWP